MNVFTAGQRHQPWLWQVTGLCFLLGLLLAASLQTVRNINRSGGVIRAGIPVPARDVLAQRDKEILRLQQRQQKLEDSLGTGNRAAKTLNEELKRVKILAGLTAVTGPGIVLTLQDSKQHGAPARTLEINNGIIHDVDIQAVLSELGQSSAEAESINGQRITSRTYIRCVGPTILVNDVPLVPPYVIQAIGNADTLWGGLNLPYGVLDGMRRVDPNMFKLEKKTNLTIPAYTGSTEVKYAKPVETTAGEIEEAKR